MLLRHGQSGGQPYSGLVLVAGVGHLLVHAVAGVLHGLVENDALCRVIAGNCGGRVAIQVGHVFPGHIGKVILAGLGDGIG